jgi:hypothetical protein
MSAPSHVQFFRYVTFVYTKNQEPFFPYRKTEIGSTTMKVFLLINNKLGGWVGGFLQQVVLTITPDFVWKDKIHGTTDRWWIWVEVILSFSVSHTMSILLFVLFLSLFW